MALGQPTQHSESASRISQRGHSALLLLLEAYEYAQELHRSVWDFAVEIRSLRKLGLTNSDFRWLLCKGFVKDALEITLAGEEGRGFRGGGGLAFSKKTCFVLTEAGVSFARSAHKDDHVSEERLTEAPVSCGCTSRAFDQPLHLHGPTKFGDPLNTPNGNGRMGLLVPKWDRDRQELRLGNYLVKQFKVPAANQEMILAAFEEEGWPPRIDDPLPPHPEQDSKRRLHDTINSLNRNQKHALIRFLGDGSGQGVRWAIVRPTGNGNGTIHPLA